MRSYTSDDAGCYVDGARGIYAVDAIVQFVRAHGFAMLHEDNTCEPHGLTIGESEFAGCEYADEYETEATDLMNSYFGVDGHYWGRSEQGDWGLWARESRASNCCRLARTAA